MSENWAVQSELTGNYVSEDYCMTSDVRRAKAFSKNLAVRTAGSLGPYATIVKIPEEAHTDS